jgi:hypothetical protein
VQALRKGHAGSPKAHPPSRVCDIEMDSPRFGRDWHLIWVDVYTQIRRCPLSQSLADLEAERTKLLQQFLALGDFRPGTVSATPRRCGKPACHCAQPDDSGHPQFRLLRKVRGKSVAESFPTPAAFRKAAEEVAEFHRFQDLAAGLTAVSEQICRLRPVEPDGTGWTEAEKKGLLLFIKRSHAKSRRFSR